MYHAIRITPIRSEHGPRFMLSAATQGLGGPVPTAPLQTWDELAAALRSVGTDKELIDEARKRTLEEKGEGVSILNMSLTDERLVRLGLKRE
jgi:hypothetical protein